MPDQPHNLKSLSREGIPAALEKAMRYRLLNEPGDAESICLDILHIDPENQEAAVTLLLAMTDRFAKGYAIGNTHINEVLHKIKNEYERAYYSGIVCERRGKALLGKDSPGARADAYEWLREAMVWFEKAEAMRPHGNEDSILRWNTCARMIRQNNLVARAAESEPFLE